MTIKFIQVANRIFRVEDIQVIAFEATEKTIYVVLDGGGAGNEYSMSFEDLEDAKKVWNDIQKSLLRVEVPLDDD